MHYLGLDVARDTVEGALLTRSSVVKQRCSVPNTVEALSKVLEELRKRYPHLIVGVESTAMFHLETVEACTEQKISCKLINPLCTKEIVRGSIRKRKTDRDDAVAIAKLLLQGEGNVVSVKMVKDQLKAIVRSARKMGELRKLFSLHARHLCRIMGSIPLSMTELGEHLQALERELQAEAVHHAASPLHTLLQTIPGMGPWLSAVILAELGDMTRYHSSGALIAAAGLDPRVFQSGATLKSTGRLTKRGSPHLRWAAFCAANVARRFDPETRMYYEKKRAEGKSYTVAVVAIARKMLYRIYAVAKRGTPYVQ